MPLRSFLSACAVTRAAMLALFLLAAAPFVRAEGIAVTQATIEPAEDFSANDLEAVKQKLKNLGYL